MQFQTGQTEVINGIEYQRQPDGRWTPKGTAQPKLVPLAPPDPFKVRDQQLKEEANQRAREAQEFQRQKFERETALKERELSQKQSGGDDVKLQQKRASLESLVGQINRVDELYRKGFKDEAHGIFSSIAEYFPTNEAAQLNAAGAGLAEQGLSAFRVPGVGAQSDAELRQFVEANRPSSWDRDVALEEKLRQLRLRVDATRQEMGLPPAQWGASQEIDGQRVFAPQSQERVELATGETRTESDPALAGVNVQLNQMLKAGAGDGEIIRFMKERGASGRALFDIKKQLVAVRKFQQKYPGYKGDFNIDLERREVPNSTFSQIAASGPATLLATAGDAVTGYNMDSIIGATGGDAELANLGLGLAREANPGWATAGDIAGGVAGAMTGEAALARAGMGAGFGRALAADSGYGAVAGAGMADDGNRLQGAGIGLLAGGAGSVAGQTSARGLGNAVSGVTDPSVQAVRDYAPLTFGQAVGRSGRVGEAIKGAEDRIAGLPVVGDMVNARRMEGIHAFNAKTFDKALAPIRRSVDGKVGEEAVAAARDLVSGAFNEALAGKAVQVDMPFLGQARGAMLDVQKIPRIGNEVAAQIDSLGIFNPDNLALSGENMQTLLGSLRQIRQAYRGDPLAHQVNGAVKRLEKAVEGMFERQAPEVMPKYRAAKEAYRRLSTIADAVNRGKNSEGVFTPGQLGMADRANAKKYDGELSAASGESPFHQFQRDAQNVLPNHVPDSGTAGRLVVPGAIVAGGGGIGAATGDAQGGAMTGVGIATLLSFAYSRQGQRLLAAAAARRGETARKAGKKIKDRARLTGATGASTFVLGTSPDQ